MADRARYALASKLFGSGIVAQLCGFLATAFAASRMRPEEFALFASVTAATAVVGSVNSFAAESRVPVVSGDEAVALNRAGFTATLLFTALCLAVGLTGVGASQGWGQIALLTAWCSAMLGGQHLLTGIVLRTQRQSLLARNRLVQSISNAVLIVVFILAGMPGHVALGVAWATSMTLANAVLLPEVRGWGAAFRWAHARDLKLLIDEVRWQPLSNVLSDGVGQIPLLVLPGLGAPAVSGAWALANRFLSPVINMAQITLQPIYYGKAAEYLRDGDAAGFMRHVRRWSRNLLWCALPVLLGCYVCLEWLIPLLGPAWKISSLALLPACLMFPMALSWLPISQTLVLSGHLRAEFVWTVLQFIFSVLPFMLVPHQVLSAQEALVAWAAVSAVSMLIHRVMQLQPPVIQKAWTGADGRAGGVDPPSPGATLLGKGSSGQEGAPD